MRKHIKSPVTLRIAKKKKANRQAIRQKTAANGKIGSSRRQRGSGALKNYFSSRRSITSLSALGSGTPSAAAFSMMDKPSLAA